MLSVVFIWLYIGITTFIAGYGVLRVITRHLPYYTHYTPNADVYFMCGLVCVTVYAQLFSLFAGVGLLANLVLCAACVLTVLADRKALVSTIRRVFPVGKRTENDEGATGTGGFGRLGFCAAAVLFFLFAYGTSRGMIHYDTGLYHAQSIRWIEEYGVVKGLGNLHCRLAYNSSSFALSALYSMAFLGGQSYHCAAGWLSFVLAAVCLPIGKSLRAGRLRTSDFARVMCVYYLVNIYDEMISPASDYFMVFVAFYIVIKWLDLSEGGERAILPYGLLCVLGVFLMTVKLSAALVLLLTVYPACRLIREKRWQETGAYLGLGIVTAIPFFIRNVVISGWLVYPFTQIDLFDVAWKIPKGLADYDAREIQVWGRGYTDVARFDMPVRKWLPGWFRTLQGSDKVLVLAAAAAVAALFAEAAYLAWSWCKGRRTADSAVSAAWDGLIPPALFTAQVTVAASFLFWLCTSPLIRYGCVWVYLAAAVVFGGIYEAVWQTVWKRAGGVSEEANSGCGERRGREAQRKGVPRRWQVFAERAVSAAIILILIYKGFALAREIAGAYSNDYWLVQKDYENYGTRSYEIEGVTFYCPVEGDQAGYDSFPSSPTEAEIRFLGDGIADGFRAADDHL